MSFDWTVLGAGAAFFLLALSGATAVLAYGECRSTLPSAARPPATRAALRPASLPATAPAGIGFAFEPGPGGNPGPRGPASPARSWRWSSWSAHWSFGASLSNLVSHPALYGWTWDREILAGNGYGNIPLPQARLLWAATPTSPPGPAPTSTRSRSTAIASRSSPSIGARVGPPILAGHAAGRAGPDRTGRGNAGPGRRACRWHGPRLQRGEDADHARRRDGDDAGHRRRPRDPPLARQGAVLPASALPRDRPVRGISNRALQGPNTILVRFRPGVDQAAAVRRLDRIGARLSGIRSTMGIQVLPVQRPAEIVNYRTMGTAPLILAGMLAAGAVVALALTLAASTRRRSRDLALLKTLGFVRRQIVAVVIWQACGIRRDRDGDRDPARNRGGPIPVGQVRQRALCRAPASHLAGDGSGRRHIRAGPGHPDRHRAWLAGGPDIRCHHTPGGVRLTVPVCTRRTGRAPAGHLRPPRGLPRIHLTSGTVTVEIWVTFQATGQPGRQRRPAPGRVLAGQREE